MKDTRSVIVRKQGRGSVLPWAVIERDTGWVYQFVSWREAIALALYLAYGEFHPAEAPC